MKRYTITKPRVRKTIEIVCIDEDDWFYHVNELEKGSTLKKGMIMQKDVQLWLKMYEEKGYSVSVEDI